MNFLKSYFLLFVAAVLTACGGGGGSSGASTGGSDSGSGTDTGTTPAPTVFVGFYDANGNSVSSINAGGDFYARATVRSATGALLSGKVVTFSVNGASIAQVTPATGLTANGIASVRIAPSSLASLGAATVEASAVIDSSTTVSSSAGFAVQQVNLALSGIGLGAASLPAAGNTTVTVTALISGAPASAIPVGVGFSASCGRINSLDTTSSPVGVTTNGSGVASVTYDAVAADGRLCSGAVNITASATGASSRTTQVQVAAPQADTVAFVSSSPAQIYIAGSGGLSRSLAKFKVTGSTGAVMSNVPVNFSVVSAPTGVAIDTTSATTDANGLVGVTVIAGTVPGP